MIFTYTYRSAHGTIETEIIEAGTRAECLERLKFKGINPIRVTQTEGNVRSTGMVPPSRGKNHKLGLCIVTGFVFLAAVVGIYFIYIGDKETKEPVQKVEIKPKHLAKTQEPAKIAKSVPVQHPAIETNKETVAKSQVKPSQLERDPAHYRDASTIGKKKVVNPDGTIEYVGRQPLFKRPFENLIIGITNPNGPAGSGILRLRRKYTDAQIYDMLHDSVKIDRDEPDWAIEKKIQVQQFKLDLLDYLDEGHTMDEAIAEVRMNSQKRHAEYAKARVDLRDLIKAGGTQDEVKFYVDKKNKELAAMGAKKLAMPEVSESNVESAKENKQ